MSTGKGSVTSVEADIDLTAVVTTVGAGIGAGAVGVAGAAVGAVAIATGGLVISIAALSATVVAGAAAVGATAFAAWKTSEMTYRLANHASKVLAENIDSSYRKVNERNRHLIEKEIRHREEQLALYTESVLKSEEKSKEVFEKFINNIDFSVFGFTKDDFLKSLTESTWKQKFQAVNDLAFLVYQVKKMNEIVEELNKSKTISHETLMKEREAMDQLIVAIVRNEKVDIATVTKQVQTRLDAVQQMLVEASAAAREDYVKRDLVQLRHMVEYRYLSPLLYLLNEDLKDFSTDQSQERRENKMKEEILQMLSSMNQLSMKINDLVLDDNTSLESMFKLVDQAFLYEKDSSLSLEMKLHSIKNAQKLLTEGIHQLEFENADLLKKKELFESLLLTNNVYRANLGYPVYQYTFDANQFETMKILIEKENEKMKEEIDALEKARYARDALVLTLLQMGYEYLEGTEKQANSYYKNEITTQVKALLHAGDGNVIEVVATSDGRLNYFLHGVEFPDYPLDKAVLKETADELCTKTIEIRERLKLLNVIPDEKTAFVIDSSEENLKVNELADYGPNPKEKLRQKRKDNNKKRTKKVEKKKVIGS
jgi:hypothetical protein